MAGVYPNTLASSNDMYTSYSTANLVAPNDSTDFAAGPTRGILVAGAGVVACQMADGGSINLTIPVNAIGFVLPLRIKRILATGTTATNIVALY